MASRYETRLRALEARVTQLPALRARAKELIDRIERADPGGTAPLFRRLGHSELAAASERHAALHAAGIPCQHCGGAA